MRSTTIALTMTAVATAVLLVGCASSTPGTASGTGQPQTSSGPTGSGPTGSAGATNPSGGGDGGGTGSTDLHGAPSISNPVDTSKYQQAACSTLTQAQMQSLGFNQAGQPNVSQKGPMCIWNISGASGSYSVAFDSVPSPSDPLVGLADYYQHGPSTFTPAPDLAGMPAIKVPGDTGSCQVVVGASNSVAFDGGVVLSPGNLGYDDPCGEALKIATAAATTIKAGS